MLDQEYAGRDEDTKIQESNHLRQRESKWFQVALLYTLNHYLGDVCFQRPSSLVNHYQSRHKFR